MEQKEPVVILVSLPSLDDIIPTSKGPLVFEEAAEPPANYPCLLISLTLLPPQLLRNANWRTLGP